jgi:hypothetical protein
VTTLGEFSPIGLIIAYILTHVLEICFVQVGHILKIRQVAQIFVQHFSTDFDLKKDWATFWAIFSQTHPVTLDRRQIAALDSIIFFKNELIEIKFLN